jgi:hypothetical protein
LLLDEHVVIRLARYFFSLDSSASAVFSGDIMLHDEESCGKVRRKLGNKKCPWHRTILLTLRSPRLVVGGIRWKIEASESARPSVAATSPVSRFDREELRSSLPIVTEFQSLRPTPDMDIPRHISKRGDLL